MPSQSRSRAVEISEYKGFALDAFQRQAVEAIARDESVVVAAPTGAGKTLIAEYAIERALREGRRIVYTSPIKALSNQKYRDFARLYPGQVGITTGDVSIRPEAPALIMTTEIFRNTIFESPRRLDDVGAVIFDEVHYLDDPERGTVWEEALIFAPPQIRVIALSATVSNLPDFVGWLESIRPGAWTVVTEDQRPVPLALYVATRGSEIVAFDRQTSLPGLKTRERQRRRQAIRDPRRHFAAAHRKLIEAMLEREELPCLFFAFSRKACEQLADGCRDLDFFRDEEPREAALRAFGELAELYQVEPGDPQRRELEGLLRQGISYHHAGVLPVFKEIVERLFADGHVRALFSTETFALGVNMPARAVAFEGLKKWNGRARVPLETRQFLQMAGRAGRRGLDTHGSVYVSYDAVFDDPRIVARVMTGAVEPVRSQFNLGYATLLRLYEHLGGRIFEACESSFAHYMRRRDDRGKGRGRPRRRHRSFHKAGGRGRERGRRSEAEEAPRAAGFSSLVEQVQCKLDLLESLGYIRAGADDPFDRLTDRGRFAASIYGSELSATELLFSGVLDHLAPEKLAVVFTALVYESRPKDAPSLGEDPRRVLGRGARRVDQVLEGLLAEERRHGVRDGSTQADWSLSQVVWAWAGGDDFDHLRSLTAASDGDIVRTLRQALQVMRMVCQPLLRKDASFGPRYLTVGRRISVAIDLVKRDLVDAEWQLRVEEEDDPELSEEPTETSEELTEHAGDADPAPSDTDDGAG